MKTTVHVDAKNYELVDKHDTLSIARNRVVKFHSRHDLEKFVTKALEDDASSLHRMASDATIAPYDTAGLLEAIANQVENGELFIQQGPGGSGAPSAPSRPATPGSDPLEGISSRYSAEMKRFVAAHRDNYDRFGGIKPEFLNNPVSPRRNRNTRPQANQLNTGTGANNQFDDANADGNYSARAHSATRYNAFEKNASQNSPNISAPNSQPYTYGASGSSSGPGFTAHNTNQPYSQASAPASTHNTTKSAAFQPNESQQDLRYKIVVEIAGHHPCAKQLIEINALTNDKSAPRELQAQQNRGFNHNRDKHRGVVEFKKLPNIPRDLTLTIPTKGYGANIRLPLVAGVSPTDKQTEKAEWENILVPIKPLAYITKAKQRQQADVLKPGWICIFWRGKLWRELQVRKNQALSDVNVEYYRRNWNGDFDQETQREAEGHWQTAAWVPYKLSGEIQTGHNAPLIMYSESQLDWPYIDSLEADNSKLLAAATVLDLTAYSQDQHYKNAAGDIGSIENALLDQKIDPEEHQYQIISEKGKDLRGYRDTLVPVVYLQPQGDFFMLEVMDEDGRPIRDKHFALSIGDKQFEGQLDQKGMLKFSVPEGIPNGEGKVMIWAEGDASEPEIVPFKVNAETLADVKTIEGIQTRCNNLGFDAGVVDGINGKKTKNAVKGFQSAYALSVDGIAGPKTQKKLKKVYKR